MSSLYLSAIYILPFTLLLLYCNPHSCGFSASHLYSREKFGGADLFEKSIGMCPLLRDTAYDTGRFLYPESQFEELKKSRKDLEFIPACELEKAFLDKWNKDSLNLFYGMLFRGEIAALQVRDSLWSAINSDCLLMIRLIDASSVKTFNNTVRKRLRIEAELWDCKGREVLWRSSVRGICVNSSATDAAFLMEAVKRACREIPGVLPSYGNQSW